MPHLLLGRNESLPSTLHLTVNSHICGETECILLGLYNKHMVN